MSLGAQTTLPEGHLHLLHEQLDEHFLRLQEKRRRVGASIPIFALEHGLSEPELALLASEVRAAIGKVFYPQDAWLPLVVYSAEMGYEYDGEEYWTTFETRTPGWAEHGDRYYIRRCFRSFQERYGGAKPGGAWAEHFSIICWPITHAVLPTDLQRHLARLIYDYRHALSSSLLEDPTELGRRLAARSWQTSSRFQNFAQNTALLGQVAVALLSGDDDESPYLLDSTLHRIVLDLSKERDSHRWLRDAKSTASLVREKGFRRAGAGVLGSRGGPSGDGIQIRTDPGLILRRSPSGWDALLCLPDLTVLSERLPELHSELGSRRAKIKGVDGPPLARGRLLYTGQQVRLGEWPTSDGPLISLENGSLAANSLLSDQCVMPPGSRWVFRIREDGTAIEVRGKFVRPGRRYVLVSEELLSPGAAEWITPASITARGAFAQELVLPEVLSPTDLQVVAGLGLSLIAEVKVRPVGFVPAQWDGEGESAWLAGECPIVGISSERPVDHCVVTIDGAPALVPWPMGEREVFVQFDDLAVGTHEVVAALVSRESHEAFAEGYLGLTVLSPQVRPTTGSSREGMAIYATPVNPTLAEVWDGRAYLEMRGPREAKVSLDVSLCNRHKKSLAKRTISAALPVSGEQWRRLLATEIRGASEMQRVYDEAECCVVKASCAGMAYAELCCDREFAPIRWIFGRDSHGPYQKLIDNTESHALEVCYVDFAAPDRVKPVELGDRLEVRMPKGGLLSATAAGVRAQVILPPSVHDLGDLKTTMARPQLGEVPRTLQNVCRLVSLARVWGGASLPSDPFAEVRRTSVMRAITAHLACLVAGGRWEHIERLIARGDRPSNSQFVHAVGSQRDYQGLAELLLEEIPRAMVMTLSPRAAWFAAVLERHLPSSRLWARHHRSAEFLLRLSSEPASLAVWPARELEENIARVLDSPVLLRAARLTVLAIHSALGDEAGVTYSGWAWE